MPISTEYGASPFYFGGADYQEALKQGYTNKQILDWMNANPDRLQLQNVKGGGGLYDTVANQVALESSQQSAPTWGTFPVTGGFNAPGVIPLDIVDQYDFTRAEPGGVFYDATDQGWYIAQEKTDYKTNYKTDYLTTRPTNYPTNLKTDYPIPDFLPTNLPVDLPTTLKTDYPTNLPTNLKTDYFDGLPERKAVYSGRGFVSYVNIQANINANNQARQQNAANRATNEANARQNATNAQLNASNAQANINNAQQNTINYETNLKNSAENERIQAVRETNMRLNRDNANTNATNTSINNQNQQLNTQAAELNNKNRTFNEENAALNRQNTAVNQLYNKTVSVASTTKGGDYVAQRDQITYDSLVQAGMSPADAKQVVDNIKSEFKLFYQTEKLVPWDAEKLGAQPPYGTFDPAYYKEQNPTVTEAWNKAVAIDDIDITERYGENNYYWQHYTNVGKAQGLRGNKAEDTKQANAYTEKALTDKEIQDIRDLQLGVDSDTITQRLLNIPEVSNEWTKARQGDTYWKQLAKEKYLDVTKPEEFAVLFRLSERPEDKQIALSYNVNAGSGITELEDAINTAINTKKTVDVKKFAALNQTVLKDAIAEMKKQKGREQMLSFFRSFSGFTEVVDINKQLSNDILGDSGVGAMLSFTSGNKAEESLLNSLQGLTGMQNNVVYNWQQWFDKSIKEKYGIDYSMFEPLEEKRDVINAFLDTGKKVFDSNTNKFDANFLKDAGFDSTEALIEFLGKQGQEGQTILTAIQGDPGDSAKLTLQPINSRLEADIKTLDAAKNRSLALAYSTGTQTEMMNVEAQFARNYIDEYLIPRFNTSKSMDEFTEYLDIRQSERNPFELTDIDASLKKLGQLQSQAYLDQVKQQGPRSFDPNFYFNPTGDRSRAKQYADQKATVERDWELAKSGDPYWASQVYRFGIDVNNKAAFARMHFEVKGQGKGYDAADDITNASKVQDYISLNVMPLLQKEADKAEVVFGSFITPEEFADEMLRGLDPAKTPDAWNEVLQRFGLKDFTGTFDELKQYIIETLQGGSATQIREQIKFLNEKREKPTQEILGITYIPKAEDIKEGTPKPTTQLYAVFQKAGYKGTEDQFYENMFPDIDRSEQALLTKAASDTGLQYNKINLKDPFAAMSTLEGFFPEDQTTTDKTTAQQNAKDFYTQYLKLGQEDTEEPSTTKTTKSSAGQSFLGEFTSLFKGL